MHVDIPINMNFHSRPENVPVFLLEDFDSQQFDSLKIKQAQGAIDSIKVIHSCLKAYFDGQVQMYKPISAQLRLLFCDTRRKNDHSLINRIHPDIKLLAFKKIKFENHGTSLSFASAPYLITEHKSGVIEAKLAIEHPYEYLSLSDWRKQVIELSSELSLNDVIRSVADQDGGAHFDDNECDELILMKNHNPTKIGSNVLFIIALAHYVIDLANQLIPLWTVDERVCV